MLVSENLNTASEAVIPFHTLLVRGSEQNNICSLKRATFHRDYGLYMVKNRSHWSGFGSLTDLGYKYSVMHVVNIDKLLNKSK